jgi:hypothetical protein
MDSILTWTWQPCDNYSRSGQDIIAEGGTWTLLDQATLKSDSFLPHPIYIAEKTWPLPKDANAAEESEIAGTSEESASLEEEGASNTQSSQEEGLQAVDATGRAAVCAAADEETFVESAEQRARRKSSRGKGHSLGKDDELENIMQGDYESMVFGHYADPEGVESVAFDGEYDQLVCFDRVSSSRSLAHARPCSASSNV